MRRVTSIALLRDEVRGARQQGRRIALVPTMGALHAGHLALVTAAAVGSGPRGCHVVVSIFVNPTQFGPDEDFAAYPRDLDADEAALASLGPVAPDVVYAPTVGEMYPESPQPVRSLPATPGHGGGEGGLATTVTVRGLTDRLCGAARPGHFDGVCTVVAKLLNQVQPDVAYFGRKDFQQLQVVRRMAADLDIPVEIVGVPTVREPDGVALSSRNAYLDAEHRTAARVLPRALAAAVGAARVARGRGEAPRPQVLREVTLGRIVTESRVRVDYVEVVDPDTLAPPDPTREDPTGYPRESGEDGRWLVAVAAHVGPARLIDNVVVGDVDDERRLLSAVE